MEPIITYGEHISPHEIIIPEYQRKLDINKVNRVVKNWNPLAVEPLKVSFRLSGKYAVMDGQHTLEEWKIKEKDKPIPATIYYGLTYEDEAKLFREFNTNKKRVSFNENLRACKESKAIAAIEYIDALESAGIKFSTTGSGLVCHKVVSEMWRKMNTEYFTIAMRMYRNYLPNDSKKYGQEVVGGYLMFMNAYEDVIDRKRMTEILRKCIASDISFRGSEKYLDKFKKAPTAHNGNLIYCCALVFLEKYNARLPKEEKLEWEYLNSFINDGYKERKCKSSVLSI